MTAAEIIERYGARLLSFGDTYIIAFSDPSVRYSVPNLCARKDEIVRELLCRGAEPEVIPPPALKGTNAAEPQPRSFRVVFKDQTDAQQLHIRTVTAASSRQAWKTAQQIAAEENLAFCQIIRSN